jgi:hypothetical protein
MSPTFRLRGIAVLSGIRDLPDMPEREDAEFYGDRTGGLSVNRGSWTNF